ncbi:MAG: hydantoinase/oxoprolinase family protein, partial [Gammaproteobacteria bacterium]
CGWDVGGAHLKFIALDAAGMVVHAEIYPTPIWQGLHELEQALRQAVLICNPATRHAATMTAELADCFTDRSDGVQAITACLQDALGAVQIYSLAGLVSAQTACQQPVQVGSANWYASATLAARHQADAILIDIGSTTTDIVPVIAGCPQQRGATDQARMQYDELVYTGIARTPVVAVVQRAPVAGVWQHLAAEQFATMADVYRVLDVLPAAVDCYPAADGGEKTLAASARRLARMAGADYAVARHMIWQDFAAFIAAQQQALLLAALQRCIANAGAATTAPLIGAGYGRFLVRALAQQSQRAYIDFADFLPAQSDELQQAAAANAPAAAVARLCYEQSSRDN